MASANGHPSPRAASMSTPRSVRIGTPQTPTLTPDTAADSPSGREYTSLSSLMQPGSPASPNDRSGWHFPSQSEADADERDGNRMSVWRLVALTVSMGGSQIAWTVELGYGTPYLLELGLSETLTSLVWLAGPISGLVVQPLIGAISDSSRSKYRRRFWIVASTALLVLSGIGLAFTEPVARALVDMFGGGQGDWDPRRADLVKKLAIGIAVFCFYCLDFALNGLQASLRNLTFDVTPPEQLVTANAWNGRFTHIGSIVGFALGMTNLGGVPIIRLLGGDQFRKLCVCALSILVVTVWVTCWNFEEDERPALFGERRSKLRDMINTIHEAILNLPKPVRRICVVQIAAFMGWFPFLFYSTTYVAEVMSYELGRDADRTVATRMGSFALVIYSCVGGVAGIVLPYLAERDQRLLPGDGDEEDEATQIREMVRQWKLDASRRGGQLKLPHMPFMLRNIWTAALLLFFVLMMSTFVITKVWQATIMISLVGICWAVACWVPFAMIMEFLREIEAEKPDVPDRPASRLSNRPIAPTRAVSLGSSWRPGRQVPDSPSPAHERRPLLMHDSTSDSIPTRRTLLRSYSTADLEGAGVEAAGQSVAGGTIMGIHNLAIVVPQFIVAIVASIIFKLADGDTATKTADGYHAKTGVAWVLRFGGVMALFGAAVCRRVPPTKTEKAMRRRLAEIREENGE